jgi:energy-coupling factor transporter ATP-binding protein EcfA2
MYDPSKFPPDEIDCSQFDDACDEAVAVATCGAQTKVFKWALARVIGLGISVDPLGNVRHKTLNLSSLMDELNTMNADLEPKNRFKTEALRGARNLIIAAMARERMDEIRSDLKYAPDDAAKAALVDMMTIACSGENDYSPEECSLLIQKFVWQVKRKLFDLTVSNHVMPVLVGKQGAGKSEFVSALTGPVREVTATTDLAAITDTRNIQLFDNFVGVIDELDKADKANVETLKRVITDTWMSKRPMRENSMVQVKQNMTFIGTSNRDISEAIVDETGNRRFVQINIIDTDNPKSAEFWGMVRAFDWLALWRSVDEHGADPAAIIRERVQAVQASQRNKSLIETWVDYLVEISHPLVTDAGVWVSATKLFGEYAAWEREYAPKWQSNFIVFSRSMGRMCRQKMLPFEEHRKNAGRGFNMLGVGSAQPITSAQKFRADVQRKMWHGGEAE